MLRGSAREELCELAQRDGDKNRLPGRMYVAIRCGEWRRKLLNLIRFHTDTAGALANTIRVQTYDGNRKEWTRCALRKQIVDVGDAEAVLKAWSSDPHNSNRCSWTEEQLQKE